MSSRHGDDGPDARSSRQARLTAAREAAEQVVDPEMPMLTLADLGVLRAVDVDPDGTVHVTVTPTYTGCPALAEMRADLESRLHAAGHERVDVRTVLSPPWSTEDISAEGRRKLAAAGVAPPTPRREADGPVPLTLGAPPPPVSCPQCGAAATEEISRFGPTACTALWRCTVCREPFEHMRAH